MEVGGGYFLCKRNLKTEIDSGKVSLICILNKPLPVLGDVNHKRVQGIWECLIQCFIKHVAIVLKGTVNSILSILHRLCLLFL